MAGSQGPGRLVLADALLFPLLEWQTGLWYLLTKP